MINFGNLADADLVVDEIYEGGSAGNAGDDPISKLMNTGNQGGFRYIGSLQTRPFVILYTSGEDHDWPDQVNYGAGSFTYYGDNKTAGKDLHAKTGNKVLRDVFASLHNEIYPRKDVCPFFVFQKCPTPSSARSVKFIGLAVPGYPGITSVFDLVAIWKTSNKDRFQNYKATFTILDEAIIKRDWIKELTEGTEQSSAPRCWKSWKKTGIYRPLTTQPTRVERSQSAQLPVGDNDWEILRTVWEYFKDNSHEFEYFAAKIFSMQDNRALIDEVTRGTIDGGRDAIGRFRLGIDDDPIYAEFSLEAKCYRPPFKETTATTIGVKETSRLISRIRNRQFGVLVTTSYVAKQAYTEIREDGHPIIFICGGDITKILKDNDLKSPKQVLAFLTAGFKYK